MTEDTDWRNKKVTTILSELIDKASAYKNTKDLEAVQAESEQLRKEILYSKADHEGVDNSFEYLLNTPIYEEMKLSKAAEAAGTIGKHAGKIVADGYKNAVFGAAALADLANDRYLNNKDSKYAENAKKELGEKREYGPIGEAAEAIVSDAVATGPLSLIAPGSAIVAKTASFPVRAVSKAAQAYQKAENLPTKISTALIDAEKKIGINANGFISDEAHKLLVKELPPSIDKAGVAYGNALLDDGKQNYEKNRDFFVTLFGEEIGNTVANRILNRGIYGAGRMNRSIANKISDLIINNSEIEGTKAEGSKSSSRFIPKRVIKNREYESRKMTRAQATKYKGPLG